MIIKTQCQWLLEMECSLEIYVLSEVDGIYAKGRPMFQAENNYKVERVFKGVFCFIPLKMVQNGTQYTSKLKMK